MNDRAKQMFMKYQCSHFLMARENEYDKYKEYNISKAQEKEWMSEFCEMRLSKISTHPTETDFALELCQVIDESEDYSLIRRLVELLKEQYKQLDSFSKLLYAEQLIELNNSNRNFWNRKTFKIAITFSVEMLNDIINSPVVVADHYKKIGYLQDIITPEAIINRAKEDLNKIKS